MSWRNRLSLSGGGNRRTTPSPIITAELHNAPNGDQSLQHHHTASTITNNHTIDPLVIVPQVPVQPLPAQFHNPYSRDANRPLPQPTALTPSQVIWHRMIARMRQRRVLPAQDQAAMMNPPLTRLQQAQVDWSVILQQPPQGTIPNGNRPLVLTVANARANAEWGDTMIAKPETTTRIYGLNVNGLTLDRRGGQFDVLCEVIKEVDADVMCGQEHNLDSDQTQVRSSLIHTVRRHWQRSKVTFGTTPIPFPNMYKPGGTFMVTAGNISGRLIQEDKDPWGRWVSHTYQGRGNLTITIFSAYQVVGKEITPGTITSASQQHSLLLQQNDIVRNPRDAFRRDLTNAIQAIQENNHEVLLLGDFNEVFGSDPDGMTKLAVTCKLIDLMSFRHSSAPPATYARGKNRLDYALGSKHVAESLLRAGYEPFNIRFHSDHRAYYLDFDTAKLFGTETQALGTNEPRVLISHNVKQNTAYIKLKYDFLVKHNAFDRGDRLAHSGNRHQFAERLDKDVVAASLAAESQLKRYAKPSWSIKLARARQLVLHLKKCKSMARTGLDHLSQIRETRLQEEDPDSPPFEVPTTMQECEDQIKIAEKEVRRLVKDSFAQRDAERRDKIRELEAAGASAKGKASALILRRLQKAEDCKQLFAKINPLRRPNNRKGVTRIEIPLHPDTDPKSCTEWQQIDVPTEVLFHLQQRNRKHFGQAHGSPFTIPPLSEDLGYRCDGPSAAQILDGTYDSGGMDANVALLLDHLKQTDEMAAIESSATVTEQEYCGKLKVWKESTTTSPSGLHLGHYKSLIARHSYSDIDSDKEEDNAQKDEWNYMQGCLLTLHVQMLNYALARGYSYERWHTVINTILFKDPDSVKIHRTRVIHIYEADYNLTLGIKWRHALYQAEALNELNPGQYGSRPRRNAIDPVFIEEMQLEITRASRKTMVQTNYDATSCYDRIIICLAILVSLKYGIAKAIAQMNASTLEQADYRIRTELGVAKEGYTHSTEHPIYGTGQGSGNSPMIWCFLSSVLFNIYDSLCHKAQYCHPDRTHLMEIGMVGFVDDSNGQTNQFLENEDEFTIPKIKLKLCHNSQVWSDVLGTSGGALEWSKGSNHLAVYTFSAKGDPVLLHTQQPTTTPLTVLDSLTKETHELQFLSPYTAHKTLGHYKEPAGTQATQYTKLWEKSDDITAFMWKCTLSPVEAWTYYFACYIPSIGYPLPCSSLTHAQCDRIQRKAMSIIIPQCGYNRHTKREIIYGPMLYGGAGFRHTYMEQGVGQVTTFLRHWRQQLVPGQLLKSAVAWHQMSVGVSYSILSRVQDELPHCESIWLASLRTFLSSINASIEVDEPGIPPKQRDGDEYLMDMILDSGQFTKAQIRRLNFCRLTLQAVTLSDITNADGTRLDLAKQKGEPSMYSSQTTWLHVNQQSPSQPEWKLWAKANRIWSYADGKLHTQLGEWLMPIAAQRHQHFAYIRKHRMSQQLYLRCDDSYALCEPVPTQPNTFVATEVRMSLASIPFDAQPAEVQSTDNLLQWRVLSAQRPPIPKPRQHPIAETFDEYVATFEPWEADLLHHTTMHLDPYSLCNALVAGFKAGSDGSVRYHTEGSFGWVLSTNHGERVANGMGPARGPRPTSYRAEACGMLSFLLFLIRVAEYTTMVDPWHGTVVTDSESVLKTLAGQDVDPQKEPDEPVSIDGSKVVLNVLCPDWDILIEIQHALLRLPNLTLQYIQGHQDAKKPYQELPLLAQINCDADAAAGEYQDQHGCVRPIILMTPRSRALIHLPSGSITGKFSSKLRLAYSGPPLLAYMKTKHGWSDSTTKAVNWEAHGAGLGKHIKRNTHYTKLVHDILPTNSWLNKMDNGKRTCPCCAEIQEDRDHILRCPTPGRDQWRQAFLTTIADYCTQQYTFPPMQILLLDTLRQWLYSADVDKFEPTMTNYPHYLNVLIATQTRIGWRQLFNGRFSDHWSALQDDYYFRERQTIPTKKKSGLIWQTGLITLLWEQWYIVWKIRNEDVHGKDMSSRAAAEKKEVTRQLGEIYDLSNQMEPSARALLCADIRAHLEQPTWQIQRWLKINSVSQFKASVKKATKLAIRGVPSILTFFSKA